MSDQDAQQNFVLGFLVALIALVLLFTVGIAFWQQDRAATAGRTNARVVEVAPPADPPESATQTRVAEGTVTVTVVIPEGPSVRVTDGVVNFYFATGSADLAPGAAEALATVIKGVESGRKAMISGFHDTTGDPALNERLAKQRADTVREVLVGLGVPAPKAARQRPAVPAGSGDDAEARRDEAKLMD